MFHGPIGRRFVTALVFALGLLAAFATPTFAQDIGTPSAGDPVAEEPQAQEGGVGSLLLLSYLCDGYKLNVPSGVSFDVGNPDEGNPNTPVDECELSSAQDGTDASFYIYPFGVEADKIEITVQGGVKMVDNLPETTGTPHKIVQKLSQEELDNGEAPVEADFEITDGGTTGVNAILFQLGDIEIRAYTCQGDPADDTFNVLNPGEAFDDTPYQDCATADLDFTVTPFGNDVDFSPLTISTVDGVVTQGDIPTTSVVSGQHGITVDGFDGSGSFEVAAGQTTVIVFVRFQAPSGTLAVTKIQCVGDGPTEFYVNETPAAAEDPACAPASQAFSVYPFSNTDATPVTFVTDANGAAEAPGLPVTADADPHLLVEDATQAEQAFDITEGETTAIYVVNYQPAAAQTGTAEIEVLLCDSISLAQVNPGAPGGNAADVPNGCESTAADFEIVPFSDDANDPIAVTVDGFDSVELPATDGVAHTLNLIVDGNVEASGAFDISPDQITPIQVLIPNDSAPVDQVGSVALYSYTCTGDGITDFEVFAPGEAPNLPSGCDVLTRTFTVTLFGNGDSFPVNSGGTGQTSIDDVPVTNGVEHTIENQSSTRSASFAVAAGQETAIVYIAWLPEDGTTGGGSNNGGSGSGGTTNDSSDSENVSELADTGIGPAAVGGEQGTLALFGLLSLGSLIGLAAISRRRVA